MTRLGIDFGTSNTAAALMAGDRPYLIPVEPGETTLPTSVFFDPVREATLYGNAANRALIEGREGRFMRALKSVLGTPLMQERRVMGHERLTLIEVVARFLSTIRERAEAATGQTITAALSGRPVRFHSTDDARNIRAQDDLAQAYALAGFSDVAFLHEPEAAALTAQPLDDGTYGLIVDIGGGTSDFSIFERAGNGVRIIASHGVRIGGTDFDRLLSSAHVMPQLGRGHDLKNEMGPGTHLAPNALFNDLATWEKIAFLYTPETLRTVKLFRKLAVERKPFERLYDVIESELGHDIAFAVEAGKIAANAADARIDLSVVQKGAGIPLTTVQMTDTLAGAVAGIGDAARATLAQADIPADRIGRMVFVGGSSLMQPVQASMTDLFPQARTETAAAFTAVAEGLAIAAAT